MTRIHDSVAVDKAISLSLDIIKYPYTNPGSYEKFAITDDGGCLCHECVKKELRQIATSYKGDGWRVVGIDIAENSNGALYCDNCGRAIVDSEEED
ncbi:MAG: hypothetical protein ACYCS8_19010 [Acidithiobacillus sp.]